MIQDKNGQDSFFFATLGSNLELMQILLKENASINRQTYDHNVPLKIAIKKNDKDMVDFLTTNNADVNQTIYNEECCRYTCPFGDKMTNIRTAKDDGWICAGTEREFGCQGRCNNPRQTYAWDRWFCQICNYSLCDICIDTYGKDNFSQSESHCPDCNEKWVSFKNIKELQKQSGAHQFGVICNTCTSIVIEWPVRHCNICSTDICAKCCCKNLENKHKLENQNPLTQAIINNCSTDIIKILLQNSTNLNMKSIKGYNALHYAVEGKHNDAILLLLSVDQIDIHEKNILGENIVLIGAKVGISLDIMKYMIDIKVDINVKNYYGNALILAIKNKYCDIAKLLLDHNSDVDNVYDMLGNSPLILACEHKNMELIKMLLQVKNCHVNHQNSIHVSAIMKFIQSVKGIYCPQNHICRKFEKTIPQDYDGVPFCDECMKPNLEKENYFYHCDYCHYDKCLNCIENVPWKVGDLCETRSKKYQNEWHEGVIVLCLPNHRVKISYEKNAKILTKKQNANSNNLRKKIKNKNANATTTMTDKELDLYILNLLIEHKANVTDVDEENQTILMIACALGKTDMVKLLLKSNPDVNARNKLGSNALITSIFYGHTDCAKLMLEVPNLDLNSITCYHQNALHKAIKMRNLEVTKLLLDKKIDVNQRSAEQRLPINEIVVNNWTDQKTTGEILKLLINAKSDVNTAMRGGIPPLMEMMSTKNAKLLIKANANVNHVDYSGEDILMKIIQRYESYHTMTNSCGKAMQKFFKRSLDGVAELNFNISGIKCGAIELEHIHEKIAEEYKCQCLECYEIQFEKIGILEYFLLQQNYDKTKTDNMGRNLAHVATSTNISIMKILIENKIDINHQRNDGCTSLMIACDNCDLKMVQFLVENNADIGCENVRGLRAISYANDLEATEIVKYLQSQGDDTVLASPAQGLGEFFEEEIILIRDFSATEDFFDIRHLPF